MPVKKSGLSSPSMRAYRALVKKKGQYCKGKVNKTAVKAAASNYVRAAVKAGKTTTEAKKTASKVLTKGCKMSANVGRKKKATTRKRK